MYTPEMLGNEWGFESIRIPPRWCRREARLVVIAFDSVEKAKAWDSSPAQKEIDAIRQKSAKARSFIVDGAIN